MIELFLSSLNQFQKKETTLPKIIIVYGPTACGKTALSIELGKYLDTEIISTDSRQIYKDMDIGTGKITEEEMQGIRHHMLDIISPTEIFSMAEFGKTSLPMIEKIVQTGKIPILCGGTGLYIDSVLYEMAIPDSEPDWKYREELEKIRIEKGNQFLWEMLFRVDPLYAKELEINNFRYIMRGLEVFRETGKSKRESKNTKNLRFDPLFISPYSDENRENLYKNINTRVLGMFENGLEKEVGKLIEKYSIDCPGLKTIGYKEVVDFLKGETSREKAIELVQQHSRNYAKRQITWNRKYENT
ncbi:tRNA (adenosine(37)-N6)-dimethylallyltransferase MiaA [Candidatus Gracilibacteria bacterium]|nr:tRNA (adenosine(37)-N6)-dimethylallyltransferase MiaA [Candidatus Gracilibacteria bacterium]